MREYKSIAKSSLVDIYGRAFKETDPLGSLAKSMESVSEYLDGHFNFGLNPRWLHSNFEDNIWKIKLDKAIVELDFDVEFMGSDGKLHKLKAQVNSGLLNALKCWLLLQSSPLHVGFQNVSDSHVSQKLRNALHLIDFLLLNSKEVSLEKHFLLWDRDLVTTMLGRLFDAESLVEGIYNTEQRLESYITTKIDSCSQKDLEKALKNLISDFPNSNNYINSCPQGLKKTLSFLYLEDAFETRKKRPRYGSVSLDYIRNKFFSNTLYGHRVQQPMIEKYSLVSNPVSYVGSEFPQHPLNRRLDIGISEKYFSTIRQTLFTLADVNAFGDLFGFVTAKIPENTFKNVIVKGLIESPPKSEGRTLTLGAGEILSQIRNAFEFIFQFDDKIFEAIERILVASESYIESSSFSEFKNSGFKKLLNNNSFESNLDALGYELNEPRRFEKIRENKDLFSLFNVLQGSLQIIVGATMARRLGELVELDSTAAITPFQVDPKQSPDKEFYLIFDNRKSGTAYGGELIRDQLKRPILSSIAAIIFKWQAFNLRMSDRGLFNHLSDVNLFTSLSGRTLKFRESNVESFIDNLNAFCDYFQTRTNIDDDGVERRLYIRQHQLRRFFAMVFYWSHGYEASETLQYFLAHTDLQHLERYVREETAGEVLRGVQAERMIDGIRNRDILDIAELERILKTKFGIRSIEYATYEEIRDDVDDELISLEETHEHVIPQRYQNFETLLNALEELLDVGVIDLKYDHAVVRGRNGEPHEALDLVLKYESV